MDIHAIRHNPRRVLELMLKDRCRYPNVASAVFHFATTCEEEGQAETAIPYWRILEKILDGNANESSLRDFFEARADGDTGFMAQYMFLLDVDQEGRDRFVGLSPEKKKTFLELTFNMGQHVYKNPDKVDPTWALSIGLD